MSGVVGSAGSKSGIIGETELDYEEGDWTPAITATTIGTLTYTWQKGTYVKIGRSVHLIGFVQLAGSGMPNTNSGAIKITGLPFTAYHGGSGYMGGGGVIFWHNAFADSAPQVIRIIENTATAWGYRYADDVAIDSADISKMNNNAQFGFTIQYEAT